ncbi:NAD(P)-dependent oxidoreductase [Pedobacter changchengzhani]|uniref:NAD(P)-dependent oxidoreductase n=2 Tax=Pedobacter changchengzhani TaxID=2529274 RepID=A0A4V3A0F2_9SPHI|nr:NAD(P)-dependent oxidoreductase [Pedobacter changchengzhani]TDG37313.1 NAD(P)-dependent oxidoreductase [Pedobacter changchengzhani]
MKITFIGLGIMGTEMASNLAKNNVNLTVYNRTAIENLPFKNTNVTIADSLEDAVKDADIVFSMLSTPKAVEEVFFGQEKTLSLMKKNAIWADCSTVNPSFSLQAAKEAALYQIRFLDAPVSGSKIPAKNAELIFFVGGDAGVVKEATPYMNMMGKEILHVGDTGKGASLKMLVNMMLAQSMLIFAEAVLLGDKMGISKDFLLDLLPNLPVSAPFTKVKAASIKNDNYDVQFPLEWMHKDLHLAAITAYEVNQPLYIANLTKEIFAEANKDGMGRLDFSAIFKYLEKTK